VRPRAIDLRIDALVLSGFERVDRRAVLRALEGELARLLAEPHAWTDVDTRAERGGQVRASAGAADAALGRAVAARLHAVVSRGGRSRGGGR
jgi:hypothetical protein